MATKKAGGSTSNGRDSRSKRRGVKRFEGEVVSAGEVLIRQKGFWYRPGTNVYAAKDWTLHASIAGKVTFRKAKVMKFNRSREMATLVSVVAA
jgi:large subunit ribosomal protein L27